ncbi:hypothetical protein ACCS49_34660, partial [Rhizobium brockwellii]|uniref:hypothetical protein n=1 Tax=Rhizobium brockwellii TaxID=3019932 RepID=UPI003F9A6B15
SAFFAGLRLEFIRHGGVHETCNGIPRIGHKTERGYGAGLGTVRASSFIAALLSNVGLTGTILFAAFLYSLVRASGRHVSGD